jgi:hypothetical protein
MSCILTPPRLLEQINGLIQVYYNLHSSIVKVEGVISLGPNLLLRQRGVDEHDDGLEGISVSMGATPRRP